MSPRLLYCKNHPSANDYGYHEQHEDLKLAREVGDVRIYFLHATSSGRTLVKVQWKLDSIGGTMQQYP